jgi:hypothetical protein
MFDHKRLVPFPILELKGAVAYRLQLHNTMRIYPVFHVLLLEPFHPNTLPGRVASCWHTHCQLLTSTLTCFLFSFYSFFRLICFVVLSTLESRAAQ